MTYWFGKDCDIVFKGPQILLFSFVAMPWCRLQTVNKVWGKTRIPVLLLLPGGLYFSSFCLLNLVSCLLVTCSFCLLGHHTILHQKLYLSPVRLLQYIFSDSLVPLRTRLLLQLVVRLGGKPYCVFHIMLFSLTLFLSLFYYSMIFFTVLDVVI